jgi:hypothetical protein
LPELVALDLSGGLNHIATVLSALIEAINKHKIIQLADFIGEKVSLQRLGYILDQFCSSCLFE